MGTKSLFEVLKGELVNIVDYAVDHHKEFGRAPSFAVNAASWWYTNMTAKTAQQIRDRSSIDANPSESNLLYYILPTLQLGIQLHFVFDGPTQLHNGGKAHPGYDSPSLLLRETFTRLAIPWHDAPGEAEAECAKMEAEGLVDAVWSEDGDALAFGCRTLIKSYRERGLSNERDSEPKSHTHFRVYKLEDIELQNPGMGRQGFILHAILCRAGKISGGLPNFEAQDVLKAAQHGLGRSLYNASTSEAQFQEWLDSGLTAYLENNDRIFDLRDYPTYDQLKDYVSPHVSSHKTLLSLDKLENTVGDENELFSFVVEKFQWKFKRWAKWIVALNIVRSLIATEPGEENKHDYLKLRCDLNKDPKKAKATFLLRNATSVEIPELTGETSELETLTWILRKARLNGFVSITSFLTPSDSGRTNQLSSRASGKQAQRLNDTVNNSPTLTSNKRSIDNGEGSSKTSASRICHPIPPTSPSRPRDKRPEMGATTCCSDLPTPVSNEKSIDNGEGSSKGCASMARHPTPPSPSPATKKKTHPLPREMGASTFENIPFEAEHSLSSPAAPEQINKGKGKQIGTASNETSKRGLSPENESNISHLYKPSKRAKRVVIDLTSLSAESEESADCILINSDSSQSDYGSMPASQDLLNLPLPTKSTGVDTAFERHNSDDKYGSWPASPDLRALL